MSVQVNIERKRILMIKRISIILTVILLLIFSILPCSAVTTVNGTVNSTALNYFEGVVEKLPLGTEYIIFKSGDYTTDMVYSTDLSLNGSIVSGTNVTNLQYNTRAFVSGNSYTTQLIEDVYQSYTLETNSFSICYSSLGNWSAVGESTTPILTYILYTVVFGVLLLVAFKFFRNRRSYINL